MLNTWQRTTKTDRFIRNTAKLGAADSSFMNPRVPKLLRYYQINHLRRTSCKHHALVRHIYISILLWNDSFRFPRGWRGRRSNTFCSLMDSGWCGRLHYICSVLLQFFALCNGTLVCWITITTHKSQILLHESNTKSFIVHLCNLSLNNIFGGVTVPRKNSRWKKMNVDTVLWSSYGDKAFLCAVFALSFTPLGVVDVCYMLQTARSSGFYVLMDFKRLRYIRTEVQLYGSGLLGFFLAPYSYSNHTWPKVCGHPNMWPICDSWNIHEH